MSTWVGWQAELISELGVHGTTQVRHLLNEWASEIPTACHANPLAASRHIRGSSDCLTLRNGKAAQSYPTHARGITATAEQLKSGSYPHLWAAIKSGAPYNFADYHQVANDLTKWGAAAAGAAYLITVQSGQFAGGAGGGKAQPPAAARLHGGYADLQRSVNRHFPRALHNSHRSIDAGLRSVHRARKVLR